MARPSRSAAVLARVNVTLPSLLLLRDLVPRADLLLLLLRLPLGIRLRADGLDERRLPLLLLLLLPLPGGGVAPTEEPKRTMLDRPVAAACSSGDGGAPTKEEVKSTWSDGPRRGAVDEAEAGGAGGTTCAAWWAGGRSTTGDLCWVAEEGTPIEGGAAGAPDDRMVAIGSRESS